MIVRQCLKGRISACYNIYAAFAFGHVSVGKAALGFVRLAPPSSFFEVILQLLNPTPCGFHHIYVFLLAIGL